MPHSVQMIDEKWPSKLLRWLLQSVCALVGTFALFMILPLVHGTLHTHQDDLQVIARKAPVVMQRIEPPEEKTQPRPQREVREMKQNKSTHQGLSGSDLDMRFTPDLGLGEGGEGVGIRTGGGGEQVFEEGEVDELPRPLRQTRMEYPRGAKQNGLEGDVNLILLIDRHGRVEKVEIISSPHSLFNKAVIRSLRRWKFSPAIYQGVPVKVRMRKKITFKLD